MWLCAVIFLVACASPTPAPTLAPRASETAAGVTPSTLVVTATSNPTAPTAAPSLLPSSTLTLSPTASATLPPTASPALAFTPPASPRLLVLAQNLSTPDDLVLAPDRSIYFSDVGDRTVMRLDPDGKVTVVISNLVEPEGLAFLPDGSMVVGEQGKNRLLRYDFKTQQLSTFLQMENRTTHPGVDGFIFEGRSQTLIVPDSPNGTLLRVSIDGKILKTLASGMARPVGADVEANGNILVADENGNAIVRVLRDGGTPKLLARVPLPDDVIVDTLGNIYVNTLGDNAIHYIDARTGASRVLTRNVSNPQGVIFDADGNLIVTDPGNHRIVKLVIR